MPKRLSAKKVAGGSQALTAQELARRNDVSIEQMTGAIRMGSHDELEAQGGSTVGITMKVTGARVAARRAALAHLKTDPGYYKRLRVEKKKAEALRGNLNLVRDPVTTVPKPATEPRIIRNNGRDDSSVNNVTAANLVEARLQNLMDGADLPIAGSANLSESLKNPKTVAHIMRKHGVSAREVMKQLRMGVAVEHEHTKDADLARTIALDHLFEKPDYYTRLKKVEMKETTMDEITDRHQAILDSIHMSELASADDLSEGSSHPMAPKNWSVFAGGTGAKNPNHNSFSFRTKFGEYHVLPPQAGKFRPKGWSLMFAHTRGGKSDGPSHPNVPHSGLWHGLGHHASAHAAMRAAHHHHASAQPPSNDSVAELISAYLNEFVTSTNVGGFVGTTLGGTQLASIDPPNDVTKRLIKLRKPEKPKPSISLVSPIPQDDEGDVK